MRALVLFTGGLDSLLAVRLLQRQSIDVAALYCSTPFVPPSHVPRESADRLGIALHVIDLSDAYARFLREPRLGYVRGAGACLDCRVAMLRAGLKQLQSIGAELLCTGDVIGQRPRTAVRDLEIVDHHASTTGQILRPLSQRLLPPLAENVGGTLDRGQFLGLQGKSRREQLRLARELKIDPIPPPRADCPLFLEPLASRVLAAVRGREPAPSWQLRLLAFGRKHQLPAGGWCMIARNQEDGKGLREALQFDGEGKAVLLEPDGFAGPILVVVDGDHDTDVQHAARLAVEYSRDPPLAPRFAAQRGTTRWPILLDDEHR